jgi:hypothetical protein
VSGIDVHDYDISPDGKQLVVETMDQGGKHRLWLAQLDRSLPPREIANIEGLQPRFGPSGEIFFRHAEAVYRMRPDGTGLRKAIEAKVYLFWGVSPNGKWISTWAPIHGNGAPAPAIMVFPLDGGAAVQMGGSFAFLSWTLDGKSALIGGSHFVPLAAGESLPKVPKGGFRSGEEIAKLPGAQKVDERGLVPGPSRDVYAFYRGTIQRNLYRIPIS